MHETDNYNVDTLPFTNEETQTIDPPFNKLSKPKHDSVVYIYTHYIHL